MAKNYWAMFSIVLIGMIVSISLFILGAIFAKKYF